MLFLRLKAYSLFIRMNNRVKGWCREAYGVVVLILCVQGLLTCSSMGKKSLFRKEMAKECLDLS